MAVKLRLQRKGRKKAPFYHIVVADSRSPRDGRFIEKIGTYNPLTVPATIELNRDRAYEWLMNGAQPTDTVNAILRFKGVLLKKHLQLGVAKGAITQEQADERLTAWSEEKENRIKARQSATADKKRELQVAVDGKPKAKPKPPVVEAAPEVVEESAPVADENVESISAVEETPVVAAENVESVTMTEEAPSVAEATADAIAASSVEAVEAVAEPVAEEVAEVTAPATADDNVESLKAEETETATTEENTTES